jgi:UDP-galactopyranose mutase
MLAGSAVAVAWYYTPMMLPIARHVDAKCTVYDCMDELASFAPRRPNSCSWKASCSALADLSSPAAPACIEAKRDAPPRRALLPLQVDPRTSRSARGMGPVPADVAELPVASGLLRRNRRAAGPGPDRQLRPDPADWTFVMVGPVVKIDPASLPQASNIHYLGGKSMTSCRITSARGMWR